MLPELAIAYLFVVLVWCQCLRCMWCVLEAAAAARVRVGGVLCVMHRLLRLLPTRCKWPRCKGDTTCQGRLCHARVDIPIGRGGGVSQMCKAVSVYGYQGRACLLSLLPLCQSDSFLLQLRCLQLTPSDVSSLFSPGLIVSCTRWRLCDYARLCLCAASERGCTRCTIIPIHLDWACTQ
jgi:hypothetical protein